MAGAVSHAGDGIRLRVAFMVDLRCSRHMGACTTSSPGRAGLTQVRLPRSQRRHLFRMHALLGLEVQSKVSAKWEFCKVSKQRFGATAMTAKGETERPDTER